MSKHKRLPQTLSNVIKGGPALFNLLAGLFNISLWGACELFAVPIEKIHSSLNKLLDLEAPNRTLIEADSVFDIQGHYTVCLNHDMTPYRL